jgi:hypothetical protein
MRHEQCGHLADLVMKDLDKLKASGVLQIEDRGEAACIGKRTRHESVMG